MPFRNSVISAVIATALTGRRIVIDAITGFGSVIEFYFGDNPEPHPARIQVEDFGGFRFLTMQGPGTPGTRVTAGANTSVGYSGIVLETIDKVDGEIVLDTGSAEGVKIRAGVAAAKVTINADTITGAWRPFSPTLSHGGAGIAYDTDDCRYWKCGRTVHAVYSLRVAAGPSAPGPLVTLTPPVPARLAAAGIPSFGGGMWFDSSTGIRHSCSLELLPGGQFYFADFTDNSGLGQLLPLDVNDLFRMHCTYEAAAD